MAVMVTGTGFVGSYVVRDLLNAGEDVVLYGYFGGSGRPASLDLPDLKFLNHLVGGGLFDKVTAVVGDITDLSAIATAIERNDVRSVIHLASKVATASAANPISAIRVNAEGTANVFEAAARLKLDKVAWASTISVFGPKSVGPSGLITDDSAYDPHDVYGATKVLCEQMARSYYEIAGLDTTGLRLSRVYGFGEHVKADRGGGSAWLLRLLYDAAVGAGPSVVPFGDQNLDFHYVEDVADGLVRALRYRNGQGRSYLTHGDYRPVAEAFDFVRGLLPDADLTLATGNAGLPKGHSVAWAWRYDASKAEADLGIRSRFSMEAGIYRTINQNRLLAGLPAIPEPEALSLSSS
jgi:nucleoside-diphosphate-sugar epimerase